MKKLLLLPLVMCFLLASCNAPTPTEPPVVPEKSSDNKPLESTNPSFVLDEADIISQLNENLGAVGYDSTWEKQEDIDAEMGFYEMSPTLAMISLRNDNGSTYVLEVEINPENEDDLPISLANAGELLRVFHPEIGSTDAVNIITDFIDYTKENGILNENEISKEVEKMMTLETYDDIVLLCFFTESSGYTAIQFIAR